MPTGVKEVRTAIRTSVAYQILRLNWYFSIFRTKSRAMIRPNGKAWTTIEPISTGFFKRIHRALSNIRTTNFKKKALSFS